MIHKPEIWQAILNQESDLRPIAYYTYPSGPSGNEHWVASHDDMMPAGKKGPLDVMRIVRDMLTKGESSLGRPSDNKTTVMCIVKIGKVPLPIYFSFFDTRSTVSLEMYQGRGSRMLNIRIA